MRRIAGPPLTKTTPPPFTPSIPSEKGLGVDAGRATGIPPAGPRAIARIMRGDRDRMRRRKGAPRAWGCPPPQAATYAESAGMDDEPIRRGEREPDDQLVRAIYDELRRVAARMMLRE